MALDNVKPADAYRFENFVARHWCGYLNVKSASVCERCRGLLQPSRTSAATVAQAGERR